MLNRHIRSPFKGSPFKGNSYSNHKDRKFRLSKHRENTGSKKWNHTSASCDLAMSTKVLAAGCTISRRPRIVAPSLEIVTFSEIFKIQISLHYNSLFMAIKILGGLEIRETESHRPHTFAIHNQLVHASWAKSGANSFYYHLTSIDVAHDLRDTL